MSTPSKRIAEFLQPRVEDLVSRVESELKAASRSRRFSPATRLLSLSLPIDPPPSAGVIPELEPDGFWAEPGQGRQRITFGTALSLEASGAGRFGHLDGQLTRLRDRWVHLDPEGLGHRPPLLLGFSFSRDPVCGSSEWSGFPAAVLRVPEVMLEARAQHWILSLSMRVAPGSEHQLFQARAMEQLRRLVRALGAGHGKGWPELMLRRAGGIPDRTQWGREVRAALSAIASGALEKVVLMRRLEYCASRPPRPMQAMTRLAHLYPRCSLFLHSQGDATLIGASPERLVSLRGGRVSADAVASTAPRSVNPDEDRRLGRELLDNRKARHEHRLVVDHIRKALSPLCTRVHAQSEPSILRLHQIQHLRTPVEGETRDGVGLLGLVDRLHPTPAVGGTPREGALDWLSARDGERGWYTGGVGWITPEGEGDISVVLRCALLRGSRTYLYAGAGIVSESEAEEEYAETELKLEAMLDALGRA